MKPRFVIMMVAGLLLAVVGAVLGDDDEGEHRGRSGPDVTPVSNDLYAKECGACHYAYPPGLLPARSWQKLMANLSDHFGENAELAPEDLRTLTDYMVNNAADKANTRLSARIARSLPSGEAPLRISEVRYIAHEHDELPARMVTENPQVKSLSQCNACHRRADAGSFNEHDIDIPGYGRWED
jgi:hypothetical protein